MKLKIDCSQNQLPLIFLETAGTCLVHAASEICQALPLNNFLVSMLPVHGQNPRNNQNQCWSQAVYSHAYRFFFGLRSLHVKCDLIVGKICQQ